MELFKRGPGIGLRLTIFLCLSIVFLIFDYQQTRFKPIHSALSTVVAPLQYVVTWPFHMVDWLTVNVSSHQALLEENADLKAKQLLLEAKIQKIISLEEENERLRALLKSSPASAERVEVARLLAVDPDPTRHQFVLAKGDRDGVKVGQPVLDASGVLGQIISTSLWTSQVMLLTDPRSAIPVEISPYGIRAIAVGTGDKSFLKLVDVPKTAGVQIGDVCVSSGLGQRYPTGYPVGVIHSIENEPNEHFATILVSPSAQFNRSRLVLIVFPKSMDEHHDPAS